MQKNWTRFLSRVLVLLMTLQLVSVGPVFATAASADDDQTAQEETAEIVDEEQTAEAAEEGPAEEPIAEEQPAVSVQATLDGEPVTLHSGSAVIPTGSSKEQVAAILAAALIDSYDPDKDYSSLEWEYECEGKDTATGAAKNTAFGDIDGFYTSKKVLFVTTNYKHPALADNDNGDYQVRIKGDSNAVTLHKTDKLESRISLAENYSIKLCYDDDGNVDYDAVRALIKSQLVTEPADMDVTIEYYAAPEVGVIGNVKVGEDWVALEGAEKKVVGSLSVTYPAMSSGEQKLRISYAGSSEYLGCTLEFDANVGTGKEASSLAFAEEPSFKLVYNEDLSVDYSAAYQAVYELLETKVPETIALEDLTIEYHATAVTGVVTKWVPFEGGEVNKLTYPGITEGTQRIRVSYSGSREYDPTTVEADVEVVGRTPVEFELKEGPYEVGMVFADAENYDYAATARAIYDAVIASTTPELAYEDITVEFESSVLGSSLAKKYFAFGEDTGIYRSFDVGTWNIRFSWGGDREYKGGETVVSVSVTDNRIESRIVYVENAQITYNMDAAVMEQAIFDNVIDWTNSALPEKDTLSLDDFTIEYYAPVMTYGGISSDNVKDWAPIGGGNGALGSLYYYPQMGAADSQQIRISYHGSAEYRPQSNVEGQLKVNKADVKVKVHSAIIHVGEDIPANFVTLDPNDPAIDIFTVYAGIGSTGKNDDNTSKTGAAIYVDLPARFKNENVIKAADLVLGKLGLKTLSGLMQDGITVGELRDLLNAEGVVEALEKLGIDTGTIGQIVTIVNKLPGVFDDLRIAIGTPNHAGIYTATAVTNSTNYNTAVGVGMLTVLKVTKGTKINWAQDIPSKITVAEATSEDMDWSAYLTVNGEKVDTDNLHYLYSGFTSKWKPYSSTTTPPTEPGRYVVTVVTLSGDYLAAPITRTFQITK